MRPRSRIHDPWRPVAAVCALCLLVGLAASAQAAGPGLHGRVFALDESGKPTGTVPGAKIEFSNQAGAAVASVTSMQGGYYKVDLPPGQYAYKVTAAGFKDEDMGRGIALRLSEGYAVYNFSLIRGENDPDRKPPETPTVEVGKLEGRVLQRIADGEEAGIPGARISLRREGGGRELTRVITRGPDKAGEEAGQYEVVLEAGSWRASVSAKRFETLVDPEPIHIESGKTATRDFVLTRPEPETPSDQGIKGLITLYGPAAMSGPTPEVKLHIVSLPDRQGADDPLTPDPDGRYRRDLSVGRYQVMATAEGYRPATSGLRNVFPQKYTIVNLTLVPEAKPEPPPARLAFNGIVYEKRPDSTERRPLPGANVLIRKGDEAIADAPRSTTDQEGKVTLEVAGEGDYVVLAQKPGYKPAGTRVTITADGGNTATITLLKQPTATEPTPTPTVPTEEPQTVTGYVVYRSPASRTGFYGIPGAQLRWQRVDGDAGLKRQTVAGDVGRYSLELPEGTYQVEVKPPAGYQGTSERVVVRLGMKPQYFFLTRLEPPERERPAREKITFRGYVLARSKTSPTGYMRVPNAQTVWTHGAGRPPQTATADRGGEFSLSLEAGKYDVFVKAPSGFKDTKQEVAVHQGMRPAYLVLDRISVTPTPDATTPGRVTPSTPSPEAVTPGAATPGARVALHVRVLERVATNATRPVVGAEIIIAQNRRRVASGRSDANGLASFRLGRGACGIWVSHRGYQVAREYITLTSGSVSREIFLKRTSRPTPQKPPTRPTPQRPPTRPAPQRPPTPSTSQKPPARPTPETPATFTLQVVGAELRGGKTGKIPQLKPLAGAQIKILQGGRPVATGQSDKAGRYSSRLKPGTYQVHVVHEDFQPRQGTVTVRGGSASRRIVLKGKK